MAKTTELKGCVPASQDADGMRRVWFEMVGVTLGDHSASMTWNNENNDNDKNSFLESLGKLCKEVAKF